MADDQLAIEELLVTDKLFMSANIQERRMYVNLVEAVRNHGGKVFIFSSLHVSGKQLDMYTGVAASLRFPLPPVENFSFADVSKGLAGCNEMDDSSSDDELYYDKNKNHATKMDYMSSLNL